jgi:diaminohydroxyphosphoribosylaminopyrimidine deaminase/5-amino-6-(5-phosphoribosylamino)uracil reductase
MFTPADHEFMTRAIELARKGLYTTTPNPRVGCVIVQEQLIVGEGWHHRAGEPHAEVVALAEAAGQLRGATVYVTLEPCSHFGRTPPCVDALIDAQVGRVTVAMQDPNPSVASSACAMPASRCDAGCSSRRRANSISALSRA